ncbi:MAG: hypothetical protein Kow00127_11750 [Bacteroidales bacterium]
MKPSIKFRPGTKLILSAIMAVVFLSGRAPAQWLSDTLDVIHYDISVDQLDFTGHILEAACELDLTFKMSGIESVQLELIELAVDSAWVGTESASFSQGASRVTVNLPEAAGPGDTLTIGLHYSGEPFHENWGGFHWSGSYAFNLGVGFQSIPHNLGKSWFPCVDDFRDRATYTLHVTVIPPDDAVCGGLLTGITQNPDGTRTYHWSLDQPIPTYLASVAVGDYARWTGVYNGIEKDVPVEIWVKPQDSSKVDGTFEHLNDMLALYENYFGPYPWDRVGYVGTAIGAMEHVTNIALPHNMINGSLTYETYVAHELAHMWFGDNVTCSSAEEMWMNEGWAVFCDALVQEALYGREQYLQFFREKHREVIQFCHTTSGDGSYFPLNQIPQEYTYGMSAYDRGATVAHSLRGYLGDTVFFDALRAFHEAFRYQPVSSYDLRDFLSSYTGIDMTPWFDNWVFHSGTPHYSVDSMQVLPSGNGYEVTVWLRQKRHGPEFTGNANRIELTFLDQEWNTESHTAQFDGETGSASFLLEINPVIVIPDFNELQCDAVTDRVLTISQTGNYTFDETWFELEVTGISDSALVWVGHQWAPPDPLQNPPPGLHISDYRYWIIKGLFPDEFTATGSFMYNRNAYLDNGIITSPTDSVIILYRPSPAFDWQYIPFNRVGIWNIGKIYVENLQPGEYALAVCDETFTGLAEPQAEFPFRLYPNPAGDFLYVETVRPGKIEIFDAAGKRVSESIFRHNGQFAIPTSGWTKGVYYVRFGTGAGQPVAMRKVVIMD